MTPDDVLSMPDVEKRLRSRVRNLEQQRNRWRGETERCRTSVAQWKACAVALYESSEATHITQDAGVDAAWQRYRDARGLFQELNAK